MKKVLSVAVIISMLLSDARLGFAEGVSNDELMQEIKALKEIIKKQGEQINVLEQKVKAQESVAAAGVSQPTQSTNAVKECVLKEVTKDIKCQIDQELNRRAVRILDEGYEIPGGLDVGADGTFIFQGTPDANNAGDREDDRFDGAWTTDIIVSKQFCFDEMNKGQVFLLFEAGESSGLTNDLSLFSNVNYDNDDSTADVRLTNLWYQQDMFGDQLSVRVGKIDVTTYAYLDDNAFAKDETSQFVNDMFRDAAGIEYPLNVSRVFGGAVNFKPNAVKYLEFQTGYFNADGSWEDLFDHSFAFTQINFKPHELMGWDGDQWEGNYRVYWWMNDMKHIKYVGAGEEAATETSESNYGFGLTCDQKITEVYGVFGRFGWQRPDVAPVTGSPLLYLHWSVGAQMTGTYWKRDDDVLALAVGQAVPSKQYETSGPYGGYAETHLETYYNIKINKHLYIAPDFQWIWRPYGVGRSDQGDGDTIFVYGVRGQIVF
ncbi:MAG TPA: carbohydrate porin [Candidatus Omnitrophota bacterium]|nr:carbohydrate porin [Candidatus Omnitrophota bacterium]HPS20942.1 carbohydrate porin [Candidatus Omnitrophota bacterium]